MVKRTFWCFMWFIIVACLLKFIFSLYHRIIRAFLLEERKIVKKVLKIQKDKEKQAAKS